MKIFRPVLQIYKKILMAFSRKQRNANPVIVKQKAAINRRKPGYNGFFGTPEGIRTPDTRLRRAVLCPAELLARMQFLFVSVTPAVENPPDVRRRPLYTTELRGRMEKEMLSYCTQFGRACQHSGLKNQRGYHTMNGEQQMLPLWAEGGRKCSQKMYSP